MADGRQEPYDPYLPSNGNAQGGNARTAALQAVGTIDRFLVLAISHLVRKQRSVTGFDKLNP